MIRRTERAAARFSFIVALTALNLAVLLAACSPSPSTADPGTVTAEAPPASLGGRVEAIVTRIVERTVIVTTTPAPGNEVEDPVDPVTLDLSMSGELPDLDPQVAATQSQLDLVENLFIGLTNQNTSANTIDPELATSWEVAPDGRTWTFNLRDDAYWVKTGAALPGEEARPPVERLRPVVADDVVFAIQRLCSRQVENANTFALFLIEGCAQVYETTEPTEADLENIGIRAVDDTTLEVRLTKPAGQFLTLTSTSLFHPVPRELVDEFGNEWQLPNGDYSTGWQTPENLVTSGPFVLSPSAISSELAVLAANPDWPISRRGNVDLVNVFFQDDEADAFDLWKDRTLDVSPLPAAERESFMEQSAERVRLIPEQVLFYIGFNFDNQVFREPEVRRAFSAAIDRQKLVDEIYGGSGVISRHATIPGIIGGVPVDEVGIGYSPDYARQQMNASTFRSCKLIPPVTMLVSSADLSLRQAELIRDMWAEELECPKEIISIEQAQFGALLANTRRDAGGARPQMWELAWAPAFPDAHNLLTDLLHCQDSENRQNRPCDDADTLMRRAATTIDTAQRADLYRQAENLLFGENGSYPIIPLYVRARDIVVQNWLTYDPVSAGGEQYDTYQLDYTVKQLQRNR